MTLHAHRFNAAQQETMTRKSFLKYSALMLAVSFLIAPTCANAAIIELPYTLTGADGTHSSIDGESVVVTNELTATANATTVLGDDLRLTQNAKGGAGYAGQTEGGTGGDGTSNISSFVDNVSTSVSINTTGRGGNGGAANMSGGGNGGQGNSLISASIVGGGNLSANAFGGAGGNIDHIFNTSGAGSGGTGGDATADAQGSTEALYGGRWGVIFSTQGSATGGEGGAGYGVGEKGGAGGTAYASASATAPDADEVYAGAYQYGGKGGNGFGGADGADGTASVMTDAVSGSSKRYLSLYQFSNGGEGGFSDTGSAGHGGNGYSSLTLADNTAEGASGNSFATGGKGGSSNTGLAGQGGDAEAYLSVTASGRGGGQADATGGTGGNANSNGNGGAGGNAVVDAVGNSSYAQHSTFPMFGVNAKAYGGSGGNGYGVGNSGGEAGSATSSVNATSSNGADLSLSSHQYGGNGGNGYDGADGAQGADSVMNNTLSVKAEAGSLIRYLMPRQESHAGNGGYSSSGTAGKGGDATSIMDLIDTPAKLIANTGFIAEAGDGGNSGSGAAGNGGNALSTLNIVNSLSSRFEGIISAKGGNGGFTNYGTAGHGGHATTNYSISSTTGSIGGTVHAQGGSGGYVSSLYGVGNGGDGGNANVTATGLASGKAEFVGFSAQAAGGDGNDGSGVGYRGGNAGVALASASAVATNDANLQVGVVQVGGNGGRGTKGADGADGADSFLNNAVTGSTTGNLHLIQQAIAGNGGYSDSGIAGNGGHASSIINVTDHAAKLLQADVYAVSGLEGGSGSGFSGNKGNAYSKIDLASSVRGTDVRAQANSVAGNNVHGPHLGDTKAIASATGLGANTFVGATAQSSGSTGYAQSSSSTSVSTGNSVKVSAHAPVNNGTAYANTHVGYYGDAYPSRGGASASGNIASYKTSSIKTADGDFTVVGYGSFGALSNGGVGPFTYSGSASYTFNLTGENDLFLNFDNKHQQGTGFDTASLKVSENGKSIFSKIFSTFAEFLSFTSTPMKLLETTGNASLDISWVEVLSGFDNGNMFAYQIAVAPKGTVTGQYASVSPVPLPAAAPLLAVALGGLGFLGRRRKSNGTTKA